MCSILVVDDEHLVIKGIRIILERSNLPIESIREAGNGEEALALVRESIPNVLITDIRMPKMDGLQLCKNIYKKCPKTHILIVSGYEDFKYAQEAIKYGVRDYLLKPVQKSNLIGIISEIIQENKNSSKFLYVTHKDLDVLISEFEENIWFDNHKEIQNCIQKTKELLKEAPLDYCIELVQDLWDMLLGKLSLKIGYTFKIKYYQYLGCEKEGFYALFEKSLNALENSLMEQKGNTNYNLFAMAMQYIKDNFNRDITLDELANIAGYNTNYFSQLFKANTGKTFVQFKKEVRIVKAMELLCRPEKTITEVAMDAGFNDLTYFIRAFKEHTGLTPNEYKKRGV